MLVEYNVRVYIHIKMNIVANCEDKKTECLSIRQFQYIVFYRSKAQAYLCVCVCASYIILLGEYSFISDKTRKRRKEDTKRRKNKYYYNLIITV